MEKRLIIWYNGIHLLTHTLRWLIIYHSKNCEVHHISSWKQKVYCKNTAKSFWLIFNSKLFVLVLKFSVLIHAAFVLLDRKKEWLKKLLVFQTMTLPLYNLWYSFWHRLDNIINKYYGVAQKCVLNCFHKVCITLFGNEMFDCITT